MKMIDGQLCKAVTAKCKFCHKPLSLYVAESYDSIGDPLKLLRIASCNRCADLKTEQLRLERQISRQVAFLRTKPNEAERVRTQTQLCALTKNYLVSICDFLHHEQIAWDEGIVSDMMTRPDHLNVIIRTMWDTARRSPRLGLFANESKP